MPPTSDKEAVQNLKEINVEMKKQNSLARMFAVGMVYGMGFFVGSAIVAVIILGIVGNTIAARFPWIGQAFEVGSQILHRE